MYLCGLSENTTDNASIHLLDFGCGNGRYLEAFGQVIPKEQVFGIESDMNQVRTVRAKGYTCYPTENRLPFEDDSLDIIYSSNVVEHIPRLRYLSYLKEFYRVLRPGGDFVFTDLIQHEDCPPEVLEPVLARFHLDSLGTVRFYRETAKELGWHELQVIDLSENLVTHYERLLHELELRWKDLVGEFREEYFEGLREGMQSWVSAGKDGNFKWAMFHYKN